MIDRKIKKRISELEKLYPSEYVNVEEHLEELINTYENILGHSINIKLPNKKYYDEETLNRDFFEHMDIEDLRMLANSIIDEQKNR